ncbi:hypothetical protein ZIOFF_065446 [Zingiber officinale]|uniref:Uncharacterized protein n=1 Tax=Zingiber officinale TaxID=94328 RepID=A0A8J5KD63_ZINOF|nr:hypothetical protein ZIOFF_065446 [Zingiber officinale]
MEKKIQHGDPHNHLPSLFSSVPATRFTATTVGQVSSSVPLIWSDCYRAFNLWATKSREHEKAAEGNSVSAVEFKGSTAAVIFPAIISSNILAVRSEVRFLGLTFVDLGLDVDKLIDDQLRLIDN